MLLRTLATFLLFAGNVAAADTPPARLKLLFLGDNGHHQPRARFQQLEPVLGKRNIHLTYTSTLDDITAASLANYDGLIIFANHATGKPEHVKAIVDYVASGKGFIPLHCASFCFTSDKDYIDLVGAQFRSHTTGVFRVKQTEAKHPILDGFQSYESWDETYVHHKHNGKDRTVLEVRTDGDLKEPWTWVRTQGKGRVFYTAWGHDQRTWSHQGFHNLVERGIRWACGQEPSLAGTYIDAPKMTPIKGDKADFEFVEAKLPFYNPGKNSGIVAEPTKKMQKPLTPEKSVTHATVPEDFKLELFASDEQFQGGKPIAMTWDERGRLWAAVTMDYPNEMQKEGEGRDKILVLEDTRGVGKADKVTVFADKLSIPTSLLCVHGGIIVHQAPHTLFLKDTDGDGKADHREVLFTGWGTGDTHAGPSNLKYGHDNWIYGAVGYSGFVGEVNGEKHTFRQGFYRFKLETAVQASPDRQVGGKSYLKVTKLEFLRSTSNNTWGFCFNEEGEMFGSTANGCALVHLAIPNRYYEKVKGLTPGVLQPINLENRIHPVTDRVRQVDWHGGFTAASNCSIYTARTYPPEYWNKTAFVSEPTGHLTATFCLQPHSTEHIARYGWNLIASRDEWTAPIDAQVGPDGHMWVLDWYNYIVQHNPTPAGFRTGKGNAYETDLRDKKHGRVYRVVYTKAKPEKMPDLSQAKAEELVEMLKHHNMLWRLQAQRLLVEQGKKSDGSSGQIDTKPLQSTDPKVKLRALLALADADVHDEYGPALVEQLSKLVSTDKNLADATMIASVAQAPAVLKCLGQPHTWTNTGIAAIETVAMNYAARDGKEIPRILIQYADAKPLILEPLARGLASGWPANRKLREEDLPGIRERLILMINNSTPATRTSLMKLTRPWGLGLDAQLGELAKALFTTIADAKADDAARIDAAKQIIEFLGDDDATIAKLFDAITPTSSPAFAAGILDALTTSKAKAVGPTVVAKLASLPPAARSTALRLVLGRPDSTKAFLDAVEKRSLRFDMLALDQKQALAAHPEKAIAERAKKLLALGGGLPDPDRQKVIEEISTLVKKDGDAANGKKVFTTHCGKCHKHGSEGQQIGPDLTGFAVHPKEEILIAVLDPSRSVEGNYKAYTAKLMDGRVITGLLASESKTSVELLDAENKRHPISRDNLDELTESKKSLMPEGFEKQVKPAEIADLLTFLTQRGKFVPIPLDKSATVVSTKDMFFDAGGTAERLIFPDWKPKEFAGVPFHMVDPNGDKTKNVIMLNGPNGVLPPKMPKSVILPCNSPAKAIHLLSGIGGWNATTAKNGAVCLTVRLTYDDGKTEDHPLKDGVHFADYIRRVDVPGSKFAFDLRGAQVRYLSIAPKRSDAVIKQIELLKGTDRSAPIVVAITVESP